MARLLPALLLVLATPAFADTPANLVLHHGKIHTEDAGRTVAEAIAIRGHSIVAVGSDAVVDALIGPTTKVVDLAGETVLPGLIDAHTHPAESAQDMDKCSLGDKSLSLEAIKAKVAECLKANPGEPKEWFDVVQVNASNLTLSRADLDALLPNRPLLMSSSDGHTVYANSAALKAAGVTRDTKVASGGKIERDAAGEPTGTLRDDASDLVVEKEPQPSLDRQAARLEKAFAQMSAVGLTSVQDARVDAKLMAIYKRLYDTHRLKMRVRGSYHLKNLDDTPEHLIDAALAFRAKWAVDPDYLRADAVKIFADGVIEYPSQTASLREPYLDTQGKPTTNRGPSYFAQENLDRIVASADAAGFTVHIHAIGDRAIRGALDAFAHTRAINGFQDNRHQIAHLQLIDPADFPRFATLDIIANFQLDWAERDDYIEKATIAYIGPERASHMYPAASLKRAGAYIVGGSDWSVSTFDPFEAMERGITRAEARGKEPLLPEEALTIADMVDAYTTNAAHALNAESTTGSLEPGKRADLILLDRDVFTVDPYTLHETKVLVTWLDGREVYRRE